MSEKKYLNEVELDKVSGGYGGYYSKPEYVEFRYNVNDEITILRKTDLVRVSATITDRGVAKAENGKYYACFYCEIHSYLGSGWLGDIDGVQFENRLAVPLQSGL